MGACHCLARSSGVPLNQSAIHPRAKTAMATDKQSDRCQTKQKIEDTVVYGIKLDGVDVSGGSRMLQLNNSVPYFAQSQAEGAP